MRTQKALVRLYTKPGCHLCDKLKEQIEAANCAESYVLEEINIETDPELIKQYAEKIPVISINGVDTFTYRVTAWEFRNAIIGVNVV